MPPQVSSAPGGDSAAPGPGRPQVDATLERLIALYQGAGNAAIDLASAVARRMVACISYPSSGSPEAAAQSAAATPSPGNLAFEVVSKRAAEGMLDLYMTVPWAFAPAVHALHAVDRKSDPLTGITFIPGGMQQPSALRIEVPDDQPPGVYTGAVVDALTGESGGHLILRLF
ncbi:hypothetical protein [Rhodopila globiformis]|uniref:Uncharacterized protein n=1 Tax=Rhodopila globiformis TaxID=1071 RepID=A0A2S6MW69_RHOGL|nr:hypothetical protein [Rhodopila globiformis]PPQ26599.1 hypothetical protein CCS01_30050 [Rhodopila globiformis]